MRGLYLITNHQHCNDDRLFSEAAQALACNPVILQYRDKSRDAAKRLRQASQLRDMTRQHNCRLIINDDVELARAVDADGVHLGRDDLFIRQARQQLGNQAIIGVSCYNELQRAVMMAETGADYIAFGRFFASRTKPDAVQADANLITLAKSRLSLPLVAIGGISPENAPSLLKAGVDMLAVIDAVFGQADIGKAAHHLQALF